MYNNKNVLIIGFGLTGKSLAKFLKDNNANVYIYDDYKREFDYQFFYVDKIDLIDFALISPGIDSSHPIVKLIKENNIPLYSELDFSYSLSKNFIIGITGTNGKTTTVNLLYSILKEAKKDCALCGNVGEPIIDKVSKNRNKILIIEISSFQLENTFIFKPNIAVILNIFEDHISRHKTFFNYKNIKLKINRNQSKRDYFILNENIKLKRDYYTKAKTIFFNKNNKKSINIKDDYIYYKNKKLIRVKDILLKGEKNLENIIAVLEICKILKIKMKYIIKVLNNFEGLKHRQQILKIENGVTYVDDSKGTNISSTLSAIDNFDNIILLIGGSDKGYMYDDLFKNNKVKHYIAFGEVREKIIESGIRNNVEIKSFEKMSEAVRYAKEIAEENDTVLLSPASASFDEFKSYEERGEKFAEII